MSARETLAAAVAERGAGVLVVAVPAPAGSLDALPGALPHPVASVWRPPDGRLLSGVGTAAAVAASGADRFGQLREGLAALFARTTTRAAPGVTARPTLLGGLAFAPGWGTADRPWSAFGDGSFVLHRWTYERATAPVLSFAVDRDAEPVRPDEVLAEHDRLVAALARSGTEAVLAAPPGGGEVPARTLRQLAMSEWIGHVRAIQGEFWSGRFGKLVAARRCVVELDEDADPMAVLARLSRDFAECTAFLLRRAGVSFLGATPETLFACCGPEVRSQALAGSLRAGSDETDTGRQAAVLAHSRKNLAEHDLVVREIVAGLEPYCVRVARPPAPEVIRVRTLLHLNTPIEGELRPGTSAVDLIAALHPTPAMGGVPRSAAVDWIARHERDPRGWYTGPVGWVDAAGDAELKVAIRCGVLDGRTAHVYSGAGIVADSNPAAEYHETAMKQRPFLRALGALT